MLAGAVVLLAATAGCTAPSAERQPVAATPTPVVETAAQRCSPALLASGFRRDDNYSGDLTPSQYSASADVQAALLYDQYQAGYRTVLTTLAPGSPTPAAPTPGSLTPGALTPEAPTPGSAMSGEAFASCVSMHFAGDTQAARFLSSYRSLRGQAGDLVQSVDPGRVDTLTDVVAYREHGQDFHAYGITGADVIELAGRAGSRLFIATVAGSAPTIDRVRALTQAMVSG
jgi:hypothetical protein